MGNMTVSETYRSTGFIIIKWTFVILIILNILSSIWVGIYMNNAVEKAKREADTRHMDPFRNTDKDMKKSAAVWEGVIIAVLVIVDLMCVLGLFGAIKESYCISMVFGILMLSYSVFAAGVDYTRGSISSWLVSFLTGVIACVFGHKLRVEVIHPTLYSSPVESP